MNVRFGGRLTRYSEERGGVGQSSHFPGQRRPQGTEQQLHGQYMLAHSIRCARRGKIDPKIAARKALDVGQLTFGFDETVNNADEGLARSNRVTDGSIATAGVPAIDALLQKRTQRIRSAPSVILIQPVGRTARSRYRPRT